MSDDWWYYLSEEQMLELLSPRRRPGPCFICGGRTVHSAECKALRDSWHTMPWGKHKKKHISEVPTDYLEFVLDRVYGTQDHRRMFLEELQKRSPRFNTPYWEEKVDDHTSIQET